MTTETIPDSRAALAVRLREYRPPYKSQRDPPLADDVVAACRQTADAITQSLSARRPHTAHQVFVVAGAMLAHGVALRVLRRDGRGAVDVRLTRDDVLSAVAAAKRRDEPGRDYYYLLRDRLSIAAGADVRMPSPAAVREACDRIGWPWLRTWAQSPRDLHAAWREAAAAGDDRPYSAWITAVNLVEDR